MDTVVKRLSFSNQSSAWIQYALQLYDLYDFDVNVAAKPVQVKSLSRNPRFVSLFN